ncbi:MAG TPA: protein kinase, partial [Polyangiales bacterium]|nr:protein kinase [Polyangiales bacterium]
TPYIVMEALTGFTLGEAFDDGQPFSLNSLIHIMSEVLRGLVAVHDAGIVHRDLKPENIFLVKEGRDKLSPKLLDFGISRSLEPESRRSAVTTTEGMIIGTPQYMSPEQARGDMRIDKGTDIYSIGTIMFEAFSGVVPFPANNVSQLLIAVIQREAPAMYSLVPQIGKPLCDMIDKALKKDRNQRYADAAEMHDALLAAAEHVPAELDRSAPMFPPEKIRERAQSRRPRGDEEAGQDDESEDDDSAPGLSPATRETVHERARAKRQASRDEKPASESLDPESEAPRAPIAPTQVLQRSFEPARYALPLGLFAVLSLGVAAAAIIVLRDRASAPVGTGMIVVQAPAAAAQEVAEAAQPDPAAPQVNTAVVAEPIAPAPPPAAERRAVTSRAKKPAAPATDPMQQMTSGVASAFAKQKAGVIECLNKHPDQVEGSPQLTVRVSIDKRGK